MTGGGGGSRRARERLLLAAEKKTDDVVACSLPQEARLAPELQITVSSQPFIVNGFQPTVDSQLLNANS